MKDTNRALLGEDIIDKTGELYGLDEEGELRSSYRPSGQPGVSSLHIPSSFFGLNTFPYASSGMLLETSSRVALCRRYWWVE